MSDRNENGDNKDERRPHHFGGMHMHGGDHDEEHDGAPEWLISFADMVMLIMGFFVILYALNATPPQQAGAEGDSDGPRRCAGDGLAGFPPDDDQGDEQAGWADRVDAAPKQPRRTRVSSAHALAVARV